MPGFRKKGFEEGCEEGCEIEMKDLSGRSDEIALVTPVLIPVLIPVLAPVLAPSVLDGAFLAYFISADALVTPIGNSSSKLAARLFLPFYSNNKSKLNVYYPDPAATSDETRQKIHQDYLLEGITKKIPGRHILELILGFIPFQLEGKSHDSANLSLMDGPT